MLKTIVYCPLFTVRPALTKSVAWMPSFMLEPLLDDDDDELVDDEALELLDPLPDPGGSLPSTWQPRAANTKNENEPRKTNQFHWYRKDTSHTKQRIADDRHPMLNHARPDNDCPIVLKVCGPEIRAASSDESATTRARAANTSMLTTSCKEYDLLNGTPMHTRIH